MNFFAHAMIALRRSEDPAWLVGSMAPDFASMGGLRLRGAAGGALSEGVEFHHRTDDAFHGAPAFVALMKAARLDLQRRGLGVGPAMGIGHVGVELLLDGCLVRRHGVPASYRVAIAEAGGLAGQLRFRGDDPDGARATWRELCDRLSRAPVPERYAEPEFVAERLIRLLSRRPRLAVEPGHEDRVFAWASESAARVDARVEVLLAQVEERLTGPSR